MTKSHRYGDVIASAYASHYPTLSLLFISYIAIDKEYASYARDRREPELARQIVYNAVPLLLEELSVICGSGAGIVAELLRDEDNQLLKRRFRRYAGAFNRKLYEIEVRYLQPALDIKKLNMTVQEDLIYLPSTTDLTDLEANGGRLRREQVLRILKFVYEHVYGDSFRNTPDFEAYFHYIQELLYRIERELPDFIGFRSVQS